MSGWTVEQSVGEAGRFHHRDLTALTEPTVWVHRVERPALVLGSSQRDDIIDRDIAASLGVEVCSRRSGGGLVLVGPDQSCWIDVLIPPTDPRWSDDVNRAFHWVGQVWLDALRSLGAPDVSVHTGPLENAIAGRFLCFAGLGPGEVIQRTGERVSTVVGLSQRRQRNIARFQGLFVNSTDNELLNRCVVPSAWPDHLSPTDVATGLDTALDVSLVSQAFLDTLQEHTS